jgi:transcriptional regulator with XRE-family HTH domain
MEENVITSRRLKALRADRGLTQKQVADELQIKQQTYSNCENGKGLDVKILKQLCDFYNVSADYLLGLDDLKDSASTAKRQSEYSFMEMFTKIGKN